MQTFTFVILPSTRVRTTCRFGFHVRRVLLFACETLFPKATPFWQRKHWFLLICAMLLLPCDQLDARHLGAVTLAVAGLENARVAAVARRVPRADFLEQLVGDGAPGGDAHRLADLLRTPIEDFELSVRSVNSLKNSNIRTLGDLIRQSESQILQVKNFGKKSLQEIADLLEREGLNFGMRFEENGEGVRVLDWGTPPSQAAAAAPDDEEE